MNKQPQPESAQLSELQVKASALKNSLELLKDIFEIESLASYPMQ